MAPKTTLLSLLLAGVCLVGCGRPFEPATPPGFVDMGEERYGDEEYRATTADGAVIGIRAFENDPKGDLAFWSRAVENRLRTMAGYALLETRKVKARDETEGTLMRMGHDEDDNPHLYVVTVFVTEDYVYVLEAGGKKPEMERMMPQVEWAVSNFLPD